MKQREIRKILVPVDGSECSRAAFAFACVLAGKVGASLDVLSVLEATTPPPEDFDATAAREELQKLVASVPHEGLAVAQHLDVGDARERIVANAERGSFDLIVLGTHGRTGRPRSLAGSVAESVVRTAPCPVLTVRD